MSDTTENILFLPKQCWVNISTGNDYDLNPVTCKASDVLKYGMENCYAKSHLLIAFLRTNGIPTGLSHQRLAIDNSASPFCLHGINTVCLKKFGVAAAFCPPMDKLAFPIIIPGEADLPGIWAELLPIVREALQRCGTYLEVADDLPDIELIAGNGKVAGSGKIN